VIGWVNILNTNIFLQKYKPNSINDIIGQKNIVSILKGYINNKNIPHLLFAGDSGIGKTTAAVIIAKELFGNNWETNTIMMNASDERGIDIVRNKIKNATKFAPMGAPFKIIFLDEADEMTIPAQRAMRDIVVKHQNVTRFIFAVNDLSKIITPIQDRCQVFRFKRLLIDDIYNHLQKIVNSESININKESIILIAKLSNGSMRRAVNALQSISTQDEVNESIIKELMNSSLNNQDIEELLKLIKTGNVEIYEKYLFDLIYNGGYNPEEIINAIIDLLIKKNDNKMLPIVVGLAEYDYRISQGANPLLQLRCGLMKLSQT
jgi:replication factor C small subunit